jgi:hypothetical protein
VKNIDFDRYKGLTFDDFRELARNENLSPYEKIGFPDSYRAGKEELIFQDIVSKLNGLTGEPKTVLDIGPGCSGLPFMLIELCRQKGHHLILVDSQEMLDSLPGEPFIRKVAGRFPTECQELLRGYGGKVDIILVYSVLHYVFAEGNISEFVDKSLSLLANGGAMLVGDIPNYSKRRRFFSSPDGRRFHREFMQTDDDPDMTATAVDSGSLDDAVVMSLLLRCREAGFDAYVLPQALGLPMANRREDILITRP